MSALANFLSGTQILEEVDSPINGHLKVVRDLAWGTHIQASGLTQSGGVALTILSHSLKKIKQKNFNPKSVLILGLGGGSAATVIRRLWPEAKIIGVDIDPIVVSLGKKYLNLDKVKVEIHIGDARDFIKSSKNKFDLILLDVYQGHTIPQLLTTNSFFKSLKKLLTPSGYLLVNRLYYGKKIELANETETILKQVFKSVTRIRPEANIIFACKNT